MKRVTKAPEPASHRSDDGDARPTISWIGGKQWYGHRGMELFYPDPLPAAADIAGYVAFWKGVQATLSGVEIVEDL